MSDDRSIHPDRGLDHDSKYSKWRREQFPKKVRNATCYCTDIDWVEWRNGRPVALLECRRALGSTTTDQVVQGFRTLNNGFQLEVLARLAHDLKVNGYIVAIKDNACNTDQYDNAEFLVVQVLPPDPWPSRVNAADDTKIVFREIGRFNEKDYADFLKGLQRPDQRKRN